jgi:hypothetical protein
MIKRSIIAIDPFVFRTVSGDAGDSISFAAQGDPITFSQINGKWTAPTDDKVFHPAEFMFALPNCTQIFTGGVILEVDVEGKTVTKSSGDGGYYYVNKDFMNVNLTSSGSVTTFWHKEKANLFNRTLYTVKAKKTLTVEASSDKQKYLIIGSGEGTVGETVYNSISCIAITKKTTFKATVESLLMEIEF